jgi:hypothetical protein
MTTTIRTLAGGAALALISAVTLVPVIAQTPPAGARRHNLPPVDAARPTHR